MIRLSTLLLRLARTLLLIVLVALGTTLLTRFAPGYLSDTREMDARYAEAARSGMEQQSLHASLPALLRSTFGGWLHGDLGTSRQYSIPVAELIRPRLRLTASLLFRGILFGWLIALLAALPLSASNPFGPARHGAAAFAAPFTLLLAVPTGVLATLSLLTSLGGPATVLVLLLAARDFKFLHRALQSAWSAPHLLFARAQGLPLHRMVLAHILPGILPQLLALATLSFVTALSAIVPVEVLFDQPGLGQLAWSAAMNRDLPVLMAATVLMAAAVAFAGILSDHLGAPETA